MSLDQYEHVSAVSDGSCSRVDLVKDKASAENWIRKSVSTDGLTPQCLKLLRMEVEILGDLNHPNIMCLREHVEDPSAGQFITILEYIPGSDCSEVLKNNQAPLDECVVAGIVTQILSALTHCHACNVVHRDVKPDNIMLSTDRRCGFHATLIDFGCSARGKEGGLHEAAGTEAYMAPDMLVMSPKYDAKVDVWSVGATAFEMLTGQPPFGRPADFGGETIKICRKIRSYRRSQNPEAELAAAPAWKGLSKEARDFLQKTLMADPDARPTAAEAAAHEWLTMMKVGSPSKSRRSRSIGGA